MTRFENRFAEARFLIAVAKQRHKPTAERLNKTNTSKNLPNTAADGFKPIM